MSLANYVGVGSKPSLLRKGFILFGEGKGTGEGTRKGREKEWKMLLFDLSSSCAPRRGPISATLLL